MTSSTLETPRSAPVFENVPVPPLGGSTEFSLDLWERIRDRGISPKFHSGYTADREGRLDFLTGARAYGLELVDLDDPEAIAALKMMKPPRNPIQPQQLQMVDTLNADFDSQVVEVPRRGSKTTTIFCLLSGRCANRPGYQVTFSAQSGVAGSRRLREWAGRLDAIQPPDDQELPPWLRGAKPKRPPQAVALFGPDAVPTVEPKSRGFKIMRGEVGKGIYWDNGSTLLVLKPDADSYRGEAADVSWLDEAQEIDPLEGAELLAGIVPLQDTKEGSAILISGTAGEARVGPFWEFLEQLRKGNPDMGGIDFAVDDTTPWELIEDIEEAMKLVAEVHPGIGTLTTMAKMRKNWAKLPRPQWAREYLSLWPESFGVKAIPAEWWENAALAKKKSKPARVAFGADIKPGGGVAAIVVAWRDSRGVAYIEVVEHRVGTAWMPERYGELSKRYRGSTIAYDDIAEGKATATETARMKPKPRLRVQTYREHAAGCVQIMRDLERGKLKHFGQTSLDDAVDRAAKREVRGEQGVWLWGVEASGGDITTLVAATRALRNWDQWFANKSTNSTSSIVTAED